jgi:hypothetical protein
MIDVEINARGARPDKRVKGSNSTATSRSDMKEVGDRCMAGKPKSQIKFDCKEQE